MAVRKATSTIAKELSQTEVILKLIATGQNRQLKELYFVVGLFIIHIVI